jgi:TM2 domain-containing membrane protein YozV
VPQQAQVQQQQHHHHYHAPQQAQPQFQQQQTYTDKKSKVVAWLLAFFLGYLGVHNFYLGFNGRGIMQLILSISFIGLIISIPWVCIELLTILFYTKDARGVPLK